MKTTFGLFIATILIWLANALGLWLFTILIAACFALYMSSTRRILWVSALAGVLGWGLPLWVQSFSSDVGAMASLLSQIIGLGTNGMTIVLLLPPIIGGLLGLCGAWVGSAVRNVWNRADVTQDTSISA